ncbi:MAG TPA: Ig-like domain-containing protein [Candidatus Dormibacteraeota bacterium]|nr:Ig-like domain-containing protein [Candidatus Dormibacteraeota bacterium]
MSGTPGFDDQGAKTITWFAADGTDTSNRTTVLTIQNVNRAPVLTQPANMTVNEGATAEQVLTATDPDTDPLLYTVVAGPVYMSISTPSAVRLLPGFNDAGTRSATVRASDGNLSDEKTFQITVNNVNRLPILGTVNSMTVNEGATADQVLTSTDVDLEALTLEKVSGPAYMTVTTPTPGTGTATGNIHLAPGFSDAGTASASVRFADTSGGFSATRAFTITVIDVPQTNTPPVLAQPSAMVVAEGATANQALSATDVDGNPITFSKASGPSFATVTTINPGTGTATGNINLAPGFSDAGEDTVTVTASDGAGGSDSKSFLVLVMNSNRAPLLDVVSNMTVIEAHTADQGISGSDPDGDALTFTRATGPTFMTVITLTGTTGTIHLAPAIGAASTTAYPASVNATDGTGNVTRPFLVTVNPNQTPVLAQPANMTVDEGTTASQVLTATDADGDAITFSLLSGPSYASVTTATPGSGTGTGNIHLAPGFSDAGTAGATVRATDGFAATTKSLSITVNNVNRPPVLNQPENMVVNEGETANQVLVATDPDGDAVTYSLVSGPSYAHVSSDNLQLAPSFDDAGTATITVRASDGSLNHDRSLTATVNNVNRPPVLDPVSSMTVNEGETADQIITGHDPDGDPVHFEKFTGGGAGSGGPAYMTVTTTSPGVGNIHLAPGFFDAGTASAAVSAVDPENASMTSGFVIRVNNVDRPVTLNEIANMTVAAGSTANQRIHASDADGDEINFTSSGPTFMTVIGDVQLGGAIDHDGTIHLAPTLGTSGTFAATVTATSIGTPATRNFTINVTATNQAPVLAQPANMTVNEGATADEALQATDPDGNELSFSLVSGPTYAEVTTTDGGTGTATGNIHLAPGLSDAGTASATVRATDGSLSDEKSFSITVNNTNQAPVLEPIQDMALIAGNIAEQTLHASDADGDPLQFHKVTGPGFMTVSLTSGIIHLAPTTSDAGSYSASASVTDGSLSDTKSFTILVSPPNNRAPVLDQPASMTVNEGSTADQTLQATDLDGDAITFALVSGPTYAAVSAAGLVRLAPGFEDAGTVIATVSASDGTLSDSKSFSITVNNTNQPPVLEALANMTVTAGTTAEQTMHATDPDGDAITYHKDSGPAFMTVGLTDAVIHLAPGTGDTGTFGASASASDGSLSDTKSFTILVSPPNNRAPVLDQPANMTVNEGSTADQTLQATDLDGDTITFAKVSGPTYATVSAAGLVRLAPGFEDAGTAIATVSASDGTLSDTKSFEIQVNNTNRPPVLQQIANMTVTEGATAEQTMHATDPDGDAVSYFKSSGPGFMTVGLTTGIIHLAPVSGDAGTHDAVARATDGGAVVDSSSFTITVNPAAPENHPPVLALPANMTVNEGATEDQIISATDPDDQSLTFSKAAGPTFMEVTTRNSVQGNIHLAPGFQEAGTYAATVRATDPGSLFDEKSFTIAVLQTNQPPSVDHIDDPFVAEGNTDDVPVVATDPDGDAITLTAELPSFATLTPNNPTGHGSIHIAPGFGDAGTHSATVTATDEHSAASHETFTIYVLKTNQAPVLAQPSNMTVIEGETANQGLSATDADGQELSFSLASGPTYAEVTTISGGTGTATGNLHLAPGFADAGTALASVTASDGTAEDSKSLTITVLNHDRPPVLDAIANMAVAAGATAEQAIHAADPDGDTMTSDFSGPSFMVLTTSQGGGTLTGTIRLTPPLGTSGTFPAAVTVTANGQSDSHSFTINVTATNQAPVLAQPSDMTVNENATQDQTLTATDADGNALSFSRVTGPTFLTVTTITPGTGTGTGRAHLAPGYADAGTYAATVSASDGGLTDPKSFLITVNNVNRPPVADAGGPYTGIAGSPVTFTGSGSDPDGDAVTLSWDFDASNGITSEATGATATHTYLATGTFTVTLTATDNGSPALTGVDTAITTITSSALEAIISLNGNDRFILLGSSRSWCVQIRSKNGSFRTNDILGSSLLATYNGVSIHAVTKKTQGDDDDRRDRNKGNVKACFGKDDLRALFEGLPNGIRVVEVAISGTLTSGGSFRGTVSVLVIKGSFAAHGDDDGEEDAAAFPSAGAGLNLQPYASPNPFNPQTTIHFALSAPGSVRLHVYDVSGRLVKTLADEVMGSGLHAVAWDGTARSGSRVSSGVYFYVLQTPERTFKSQLVVTK